MKDVKNIMKDVCCVCKTRTSRRFSPSKSFEETIKICFKVNDRHGKICDTCKGCIYAFRRSNEETTKDYSWRVDCRVEKKSLAKKRSRKLTFPNTKRKLSFQSESQQHAFCLHSLPNHVTTLILSYLPPTALVSFSVTSKYNYELATSSFLWKNLFSRKFGVSVRDFYCSLCDESTLNWFHVYKLATKIVVKNLNLLSESKNEIRNLAERNEELDKKNYELLTSLVTKNNILKSLLEGEGDVSQLEERIFRRVVEKKFSASNNGHITAKNKHGRPITLTKVRIPEVPSNLASKSTIRSRSKAVEKGIETSTTTSKQDTIEKTEAKNVQITSLMKRDDTNFSVCAKEAGIIFGCKFTVEQAAALKKEMPWELWRLVKRSLKGVTGMDLLGSEVQLRDFLKKENLEYECGVFETEEKKKVTFVRVTSVRQTLKALFDGFNANGEQCSVANIQENHMVVLIAGDKGSSQTKLMMTLLNSSNQHSRKRAKMLAIFEGDKDTRECMEKVSIIISSVFRG